MSLRGDIPVQPTLAHTAMLAPLPVAQQVALAPVIAELPVRRAREVVREARRPFTIAFAPVDQSPSKDYALLMERASRRRRPGCRSPLREASSARPTGHDPRHAL